MKHEVCCCSSRPWTASILPSFDTLLLLILFSNLPRLVLLNTWCWNSRSTRRQWYQGCWLSPGGATLCYKFDKFRANGWFQNKTATADAIRWRSEAAFDLRSQMACDRHFCGVSLRLVCISATFFATLVSKSARALSPDTPLFSGSVTKPCTNLYTATVSWSTLAYSTTSDCSRRVGMSVGLSLI